jgi:predicted nucleotidyltransferase
MQQAEIQQLERFFSSPPDRGIASVYVFGSHAEGRSHRESDVDLAVLLQWDRYPSRRARFDARVSLGSELIAVLHQNAVDLVILNDVLFSLLTVCQLVIDLAGELSARQGMRFEDYTEAVRNLGAFPEFSPELVRSLERLPGLRNVLTPRIRQSRPRPSGRRSASPGTDRSLRRNRAPLRSRLLISAGRSAGSRRRVPPRIGNQSVRLG